MKPPLINQIDCSDLGTAIHEGHDKFTGWCVQASPLVLPRLENSIWKAPTSLRLLPQNMVAKLAATQGQRTYKPLR